MKLTGHTILITGGGTGIGSGLARAFHERGNKVIITGRRAKILRDFSAPFPGMEAYAMDVSKEADVQRLYKVISKKFPSLDVLINNAGVGKVMDFAKPESLPRDLFEEVETNLKGLIRVSRAFLPLLMGQAASTLVNISSGLAFLPLGLTPLYGATKAGVHSFTQALRYQLRDTPVKVVELFPPAVATHFGKVPGAPDVKYPQMPLEKFIPKAMKALSTEGVELAVGASGALR
ncbi:MAG TPA: SDR family NAD(P)-dependent oxidoreductase, partial [bacterium]|nr:SDR family NAD(P)-dependent oxidoreductase [bacterium]